MALGASMAVLLSTPAGVPNAVAATAASAAVMAQSGIEAIALQCQLQGGPWRPCRMRIESIGEHWWLDVGHQVLEFRHDGRGLTTVKQGAGPLKTVESRWDQASSALCWDGICTLGAIPLD